MSSFEPLLSASPQVQFHVAAALLSIVVGPFALFRKRRDRLHKTLGYVWITSMTLTALSSLVILEVRMIGPFSPIHGLSILTLWGLYVGVRYAIQRNIVAHRRTMQSLYFWALGIAGILTLLPGRIMNTMLVDAADGPRALLAISVAAVGSVAIWVYLGKRRPAA